MDKPIFSYVCIALCVFLCANPLFAGKQKGQPMTKLVRFKLNFSDAYLVYVPDSGTLQIAAQGTVLSYGGDWEVKKLKGYLFHLRLKTWQDFYWKVNTSRKQVFRVRGNAFGTLGGEEKELTGLSVEPTGDKGNPERFRLNLTDAYMAYTGKGSPQLISRGNVLSYCRDWQVKRLKAYLYHFKQNNWKGFFWKVNTSRKEVYQVTGGTFGELGGTSKQLTITAETY